MALTVDQLQFLVSGRYSTTAGLASVSAPFSISNSTSLATGTGSGQADKMYTTTVSLAGSATTDIDLAGSLTDAFGAALTFVKIKLVYVAASSSNNASNAMQVTRPGSNGVPLFMAAGDGISLVPGAVFLWWSTGTGVTVTAGTGDLLTFTNSAGTNTITANVVIIGTSA